MENAPSKMREGAHPRPASFPAPQNNERRKKPKRGSGLEPTTGIILHAFDLRRAVLFEIFRKDDLCCAIFSRIKLGVVLL